MIIDLRKIASTGKEESNFFFEYTPVTELSSIPEVSVLYPVKVNGTATLTGKHSCYVEGEVSYILKGSCSRCLDMAEREYFLTFGEEVDDNPDSVYQVKNDLVDLGKIVEDAILTDMPVAFLCREDCKGLCPNCGVNLNKENCKCNK